MTPSRRRVLVVTTECSADPRAGGEIRTHRLLRALGTQADVRVVVVTPTDGEALRRSVGAVQVDVFPHGSGRLSTRARALLRGWPVSSARWWRPEVARIVEEEARSGSTIVIEHPYLDMYRPRHGAYVLSVQNVEHVVHRSLPASSSPLLRAQMRWELAMLTRMERAAAQRDRTTVVAVSAEDAALLGPRAVVVENGTDLPADVARRPDRGLILYVGSMTWAPNREAIRWWLDAVRPELPEGLPPLTVVGRGGHAAFGGVDGLDVRDEVADMGTVLRESRVVVVPLLHGSGTRLKVLEALAWRRPVVTTTKGAEGLRTRNGEHLLVADSGSAFAAAVVELWSDEARVEALVKAGRELVESYDWKRIGEQYVAVVLAPRSTGGA